MESLIEKEIEHKGEKFVPKLKLLYLGYRELTYMQPKEDDPF